MGPNDDPSRHWHSAIAGHEKALNHPNCIVHLHHFIIEHFRNQFTA